MIALPMDRDFKWASIPKATLLLIAFNLMVFFLWQWGDEDRWQSIIQQYAHSSLPRLEYPVFTSHLYQTQRADLAVQCEELWKSDQRHQVYRFLLEDESFTQMISKQDADFWGGHDFPQWFADRQKINPTLKTISSLRYGLIPHDGRAITYFISPFLHSHWASLLGNMLLLLIIGVGLERKIGSFYFGLSFMLCALFGGVAHTLFQGSSFTPVLGATGAVNGMLAMMLWLHKLNKIPFFYFVVVRFGFVEAYAVLLAIPGVLNLVLQVAIAWPQHIPYLAHFSPLILGTLLMAGLLRWMLGTPVNIEPETDEDLAYREALDKALKQIELFNFTDALKQFEQLAKENPGRVELTSSIFSLQGITQQPEIQKQTGLTLFTHATPDPKDAPVFVKVLTQYLNLHALDSIPAKDQVSLVRSAVACNELKIAGALIKSLEQQKVRSQMFKKALSELISACEKAQDSQASQRFKLLLERISRPSPDQI